MTDTELRTKCEQLAPAGCATSAAVLRLLDELAAKDDLIRAQCDRIAAQSELLARRAEPDPELVRLRGREAELLAKLAYQSEVMKKLVESKYPAVRL